MKGGQRVEDTLHAEFESDRERYEIEEEIYQEAKRQKPQPPGLVKARQAGPEAEPGGQPDAGGVAEILSQNLRGLTAPYDELSTFILGFNQYKGGSGNDQAIVNKLWHGATTYVDRKSGTEYGEPLRIPHPFVSITGNLTPSLLPRMHSKAIDDGFFDRWLYCWPDRRRRLLSHERGAVPPHLIASWEIIGRRLFSRPMEEYEPGKFKPWAIEFSDGGRAAWDCGYDDHTNVANDPDFSESLQGPWSKLEVYSSRLALILAVLNHASQKTVDMTELPVGGGRRQRRRLEADRLLQEPPSPGAVVPGEHQLDVPARVRPPGAELASPSPRQGAGLAPGPDPGLSLLEGLRQGGIRRRLPLAHGSEGPATQERKGG